MMGIFMQVNTESPHAVRAPIGYLIQEDGCWEWVGNRVVGYGQLVDPRTPKGARKLVLAHRYIYETQRSPIPEGKECHHICANRACVNPDHIAIVTRQEHMRQDPKFKEGRDFGAAYQRSKTHCPQGHPYSGDNLGVSCGRRSCRACRRAAYHRGKTKRRVSLHGGHKDDTSENRVEAAVASKAT